MAEAFYRLKSTGGPWYRAVGVPPITVSELVQNGLYEYLRGDETIAEVNAGAALDLITRPLGPAGSADFRGDIDTGWYIVTNSNFPAPVVQDDDRLVWTLGNGVKDDPGVGTNAGVKTTRVVTDIGDGDWSMTVKLDDHPTVQDSADLMSVGFYVGNAGNTQSIRAEFYTQDAGSGSASGKVFEYIQGPNAGVVRNGLTSFGSSLLGIPSYMRLVKTGDNWSLDTSWNGTDFTVETTWTDAVVVGNAGFYFAHNGTTNREGIGSIDYIHVDGHNPPSLTGTPVNTSIITDNFVNLSNWVNDSIGGGTASVSGNVLTLTKTAANQSAGRLLSLVDHGPDVGVLFRWRRPVGEPGDGDSFLAVGIRGVNVTSAGNWGNQYSADKAIAYEGSHNSSLVRILENYGDDPDIDGGRFRGLWYEDSTGVSPSAGWVWVRMEAIGPAIRFKTWLDGDAEPGSWTLDGVVDEYIRNTGRVGISFAHNNGFGNVHSAQLADFEIYAPEL